MRKAICLAALCLFILNGPALAGEPRWYKGNTHTHTNKCDGNEWPRRVVRWYVDHEYSFLVITDHNIVTPTAFLDTDENDDFLLIPGEEVTDRAEGKPVHMCAIGIDTAVAPRHGKSIVETLRNDLTAVRAAGGIAVINHPNWKYAFGAKELAEVKDARFLEVYNVTKESNNLAAGGMPGTENIWDALLARGMLVYGLVADDTHDYTGEFSSEMANPGRGWIMVRADALTREAITAAIEKGDFYGSTGVVLKNVSVTDREYTVEIAPAGDVRFTTLFIGKGGTVLKEDFGRTARYEIRGDEGYVRAKVLCSTGDFAITQPVLVAPRSK